MTWSRGFALQHGARSLAVLRATVAEIRARGGAFARVTDKSPSMAIDRVFLGSYRACMGTMGFTRRELIAGGCAGALASGAWPRRAAADRGPPTPGSGGDGREAAALDATPAAVGHPGVPAAGRELGILLGTYSTDAGPPGRPALATGKVRHALTVIDLDAARRIPRLIDLTFNAHGVHPHPHDPRRVLVVEKRGQGGCEVDLARLVVARPVFPARGNLFYGHGAWSADGSRFFSVESRVSDGFGTIAVRDGTSMAVLGTLATHGSYPHDCRFVGDGSILAITNGGGKKGQVSPSVTYVDVDADVLVETVPVTAAHLNAGHLALGAAGQLVVVSAPRLGSARRARGGLSIRLGKRGPLITMSSPRSVVQAMKGEVLSVAVDSVRGIVAATCPAAGQVSFWSLASATFLSTVDLTYPSGITMSRDRSQFLVSHEPNASLVAIDALSLLPIQGSALRGAYLRGSHLVTHAIPRMG